MKRVIRRKGFRDKVVPAPKTIEQNLDVPKGKPVTFMDLMKFGRAGCRNCKGRGANLLINGLESPCACATKRMFKAHPELIVEANGNAWWPFKATTEGPGQGDLSPTSIKSNEP